MDSKKVVILVREGIPYKKTIQYGYERARELGAKMELVGVIPNIDDARMMGMALCEVAPYATVSRNMESETTDFLEKAVQFCLDSGITVESRLEHGGMDVVLKRASGEKSAKLVIVPTPVKDEHFREFLCAIKHLAHDVFDRELRCPVVSVVSA